MTMRECFAGVKDPRQAGKVMHKMGEIIVMVTCAVIAGCDVWEDIADFCRVKEEWLRKDLQLRLENGIPSHDTLQRVFQMMNPKEFEAGFIKWVANSCGEKCREIISVDGKTIRGSKSEVQKPVHMVSAWANQARIVLGQQATDEKSNEITAVPMLLDLLNIEGCIVTADAMSCQKAIVKKVVEKKADYVLGLKENQRTVCEEAAEYFHSALEEPRLYPEMPTCQTAEKGHGRIENRRYYLIDDQELLARFPGWDKMNGIGVMRSEITEKNITTREEHFYITSLTDVNEFAKAARAHWGVESSLHWCLDMTFREDYSRTRKDYSAENFAVIRHIALNVLKNMDDRMSLPRRRRHCAYDDAYLKKVILSIHA